MDGLLWRPTSEFVSRCGHSWLCKMSHCELEHKGIHLVSNCTSINHTSHPASYYESIQAAMSALRCDSEVVLGNCPCIQVYKSAQFQLQLQSGYPQSINSSAITSAMSLDTTTAHLGIGTNTNDHAEQSPIPQISTRHLCTSCQLTFADASEQRIHMKEPWQYVEANIPLFIVQRLTLNTACTISSGA